MVFPRLPAGTQYSFFLTMTVCLRSIMLPNFLRCLVPIYDFSKLDFDFDVSLDGVNLMFDRIYRDPGPNTPAVVAYYPSTYLKDSKNIVTFNIKWLGVL